MNQRKPSPLQIELLKLLYKFRFTTAPLLASHKHKSIVTITQALKTLLDKKYIDRNYSSAYKLAGRGAEYYLTNEGIRYLKQNYKLSELVLHAMYKNKTIGQPFVQKCLLIHRIYLQLQAQYPDKLTIHTRTELTETEGFPEQLSDLYIFTDDAEYLLDIFNDTLFYLVKKRIDQLLKHYESHEWPDKTYPTILLVFPDSRLETKAQAYIDKLKDDAFIDDEDLYFFTTTIKALIESSQNNVWSNGRDQTPTQLL